MRGDEDMMSHDETLRTRPYPNDRFPQIPYDLIREITLAIFGMGILVVLLAFGLSSPDVPALTAKQVAQQDPELLVQTELNALTYQSAIAQYGPPYNNQSGALQGLGSFSPQKWAGIQFPIDTAKDYVLHPLSLFESMNPALKSAIAQWEHASAHQQKIWADHLQALLPHAQFSSGLMVLPPNANVGPLGTISNSYLELARTGLLEAAIDGVNGPTAVTNRTKSLLFLENQADTDYASQLNMLGNEWGVIKETGNYPGAVWLWFYSLLYQIPPYNTSSAADLMVILTVIGVTLILIFLPFIPGLRDIPRWVGLYKVIWRNYYKKYGLKKA